MAKHPMADIASLDKAASWVNMLYIALVTLTLLATVVIVILSHQRLAAKDEELKRVRAEMQQRVAAANQRYTEAFERASKSDAALTKAQSDIAAALLARDLGGRAASGRPTRGLRIHWSRCCRWRAEGPRRCPSS
jgi:biopolymer transport protein ExbB/TolQ